LGDAAALLVQEADQVLGSRIARLSGGTQHVDRHRVIGLVVGGEAVLVRIRKRRAEGACKQGGQQLQRKIGGAHRAFYRTASVYRSTRTMHGPRLASSARAA